MFYTKESLEGNRSLSPPTPRKSPKRCQLVMCNITCSHGGLSRARRPRSRQGWALAPAPCSPRSDLMTIFWNITTLRLVFLYLNYDSRSLYCTNIIKRNNTCIHGQKEFSKNIRQVVTRVYRKIVQSHHVLDKGTTITA